jgi:hypothetical protein
VAESFKLPAVLAAALALRLGMLTGFYGSDDFVYADAVSNLLRGNWHPFGYIGSVRYGFNLPVAFSIWLFGASEYGYTVYPLVCSLANIYLIWRLGTLLFNANVGFYAAFFMAFCPLDVIWSGRIQPDAPLMMWMTASVLCFIKAGGAKDNYVKAMNQYFVGGLCLGIAYTTKNAALFLIPLFAYISLFGQSKLRYCVAFALGFLVILGCETSFFWSQTGNPFYTFALQAEFNRRVVDSGVEFTTSVLAYPYWAFVTLQHSGLMFYFALGSCILYTIRGEWKVKAVSPNLLLVSVWFVSLFSLLTFYVMSWNPVTLIWKQPNYMLMFMPAVALLVGFFIQVLNRHGRAIALAVFALSSIFFGVVEHEVLAAESYNARATAQFYRDKAKNELLFCGMRDCGVVTMFTQFQNRDHIVPYDNPYRNAKRVANLPEVASGYVSINTHWLRRSWNSVPPDNQQLLANPPRTWRLQAEFIHNPRGIISLGDATLSYFDYYGWLPHDWAKFLRVKIQSTVFPGPVRIYQVIKSVGS